MRIAAPTDELLAAGAVGGLARGEVIDPRSLHARAEEVARRQPAPATRATYAGVYRAFCGFLGAAGGAEALNAESVRAWRDLLERQGRSPATIAKHLSALRTLADALGSDPQIAKVRSQTVARGQPRALSAQECARLLRMPDRRTTRGKRDLALLYLLGTVGLRRSEACALMLCDVDERRRAPHVLRHTFCTQLADVGVDVGVIRELAGHADIRTTTIYTAVNEQRLEDGIAAVRASRTRGLARLARRAA